MASCIRTQLSGKSSDQKDVLNLENTIDLEVKSVFSDLYKIMEQLNSIRERMENGANSPDVFREYDRLNLLFESRDGYNIDVKIKHNDHIK